jgi:lysophospholipase L1-like esterase
MISSLFADVVAWFRGWSRPAEKRRRRSDSFAPPRLEVLEDRCLLSASTTTVPAVADIPSFIAQADQLAAAHPRTYASVAFLGDSISWQYAYGTGAPLWNAFLAPAGMASYGVIGQTTQSLLYQLSLGQLGGSHPAAIVLNIGGNNLLQGDTPQATAAGILADVAAIHQSLPQTQVLVLGVLPGMQSPNDPYRIAGAETDALASSLLAGDPHATFVNLEGLFVQADGTIPSSQLFDYLHPSELGYIELTLALLPSLFQALEARSSPPLSTSTLLA